MVFYESDFFKEPVFYSVNSQKTRCLNKKSTAFVNVKTYVFASPKGRQNHVIPLSTSVLLGWSKTVILGRQQLYAVPARSTAQEAILELTPVIIQNKI